MRVLVCGGRDFTDRQAVYTHLNRIHAETPITLIIHGHAKGADRLGWDWARIHRIPARGFHADWDRHGKKAGPIRNRKMLAEGRPELVLAFPTPNSVGTWHMITISRAAGVRVEVVVCDG